MVMNGSFNGYNRLIPSGDKPGGPIEQLWFFTFCPKPPKPQNQSKVVKMASTAIY